MSESSALLGAIAPSNAVSSSSSKPTKRFYKTRAGIGGKLKDADPLVVWFLGLAFSLPAIILVLLPLFECTVDTCTEDNGNISISSVIEYVPLATVYAVLGSITLTILCYYQLIVCKRGWKICFAVLGFLCLLVPLMLPLSSPFSGVYHDIFAVLGFGSEVVFIILVFCDIALVAPVPPNGSYVVYACAIAVVFALCLFVAGVIVGTADEGYNLVYEIIAEYLISLAALSLVKVLEYFDLYPMPRQFDECCWPETWGRDGGAKLVATDGNLGTAGVAGSLDGTETQDDDESAASAFRDTSV